MPLPQCRSILVSSGEKGDLDPQVVQVFLEILDSSGMSVEAFAGLTASSKPAAPAAVAISAAN